MPHVSVPVLSKQSVSIRPNISTLYKSRASTCRRLSTAVDSSMAAADSSSSAAGSMPISELTAETPADRASLPRRTYSRYLHRHSGRDNSASTRISRVSPRAISERGSCRCRASSSVRYSRVRAPAAVTSASHAPCTTVAPAHSVSPAANGACALRPSSSDVSASTAPCATVQSAGTGLPASSRSRSPSATAAPGRVSCPSPASTTTGGSGASRRRMARLKHSSAPMQSAACSSAIGKNDSWKLSPAASNTAAQRSAMTL